MLVKTRISAYLISVFYGDFRHTHTVLFTGADTHSAAILDIEDWNLECNSVFHGPAEEHIINFPISWFPLYTILLASL